MAAKLRALAEAITQLDARPHDEHSVEERMRLRARIDVVLARPCDGHWWCQHPTAMACMVSTLELHDAEDGVKPFYDRLVEQLGLCRSCVDAYHSAMPKIRDDLAMVFVPESVKTFFQKISQLDAQRINKVFATVAVAPPPAPLANSNLKISTALYEILSNRRLWSDLRIVGVVSSWLRATSEPIKYSFIDNILLICPGLLQWSVCPDQSTRDWATRYVDNLNVEVPDEWLHILASGSFNMSLLELDLPIAEELSMFLEASNCAQTPASHLLRPALCTVMKRMNQTSSAVLRASLDSLPDFARHFLAGDIRKTTATAEAALAPPIMRPCSKTLEFSARFGKAGSVEVGTDLAPVFVKTKNASRSLYSPPPHPFYRDVLKACMSALASDAPSQRGRQLDPLPASFSTTVAYVDAFLPALVEECREALQRRDASSEKSGYRLRYKSEGCHESMRSMTFGVEVIADPLSEILSRPRSDGKRFGQEKLFNHCDAVLLEVVESGQALGNVQLIGIVSASEHERFSGSNGPSGAQDSVEVMFLNDGDHTCAVPGFNVSAVAVSTLAGTRWRVTTLGNVVTCSREYVALQSLRLLPDYFKMGILTPDVYKSLSTAIVDMAVVPRYVAPKLWETIRGEFNESQLKAMHYALNNYSSPFSLLQGPPGTGKTRTILALVSGFLSVDIPPTVAVPRPPPKPADTAIYSKMTQRQIVSASLVRQTMAIPSALPVQLSEPSPYSANVLLCAPSNGALDELVFRVVRDGLWNRDGDIAPVRPASYYQQAPAWGISIVRLGKVDENAPEMVKSVCLHHIIKQEIAVHPDMTKLRVLREEKRMLFDYIKGLRNKTQDEKGPVGGNARSNCAKDHDKAQSRLTQVFADIRRLEAKIVGLEDTMPAAIVSSASIVACTLSTAGSGHFKGLNRGFDVVIVDEAAQAVELSSLIPIGQRVARAVFVGDPKQLPATVTSVVAAEAGYARSLLERLSDNGLQLSMLSVQYRMHPLMREFPSQQFYDDKLIDAPNVLDRITSVCLDVYENPCFRPFVFYDLRGTSECASNGSKSNLLEAAFCVDLCSALFRICPGVLAHNWSLGIITPYRDQVEAIQKAISKCTTLPASISIEVGTVDGFQGREKDVIIFSCVRASDRAGGIGFLKDTRRLNVGLTRAKRCLFVVGNARTLRRDKTWGALVRFAKAKRHLIRAQAATGFAAVVRKLDQDRQGLKPHFKNQHDQLSRATTPNPFSRSASATFGVEQDTTNSANYQPSTENESKDSAPAMAGHRGVPSPYRSLSRRDRKRQAPSGLERGDSKRPRNDGSPSHGRSAERRSTTRRDRATASQGESAGERRRSRSAERRSSAQRELSSSGSRRGNTGRRGRGRNRSASARSRQNADRQDRLADATQTGRHGMHVSPRSARPTIGRQTDRTSSNKDHEREAGPHVLLETANARAAVNGPTQTHGTLAGTFDSADREREQHDAYVARQVHSHRDQIRTHLPHTDDGSIPSGSS